MLLNGVGNLVFKATEKVEVLNSWFASVFTDKTDIQRFLTSDASVKI